MYIRWERDDSLGYGSFKVELGANGGGVTFQEYHLVLGLKERFD